MIKIVSDYSDMDHTLHQLMLMPTEKMAAELGVVLHMAYETTQAEVHKVTASLAMSGREESSASSTDAKWTGTITYGGPSAGVHNPVVYAYYEKRRGGEHDFVRGVAVVIGKIGEMMAEGLAHP